MKLFITYFWAWVIPFEKVFFLMQGTHDALQRLQLYNKRRKFPFVHETGMGPGGSSAINLKKLVIPERNQVF